MQNLCLKKILVCVGISVVLSLFFLVIATVLVYFNDFDDKTVMAVILGFSAFSVLISAFILARNIAGGGLINGLALGLGYCMILVAMSWLINGSVAFDVKNITRISVILASGMLGGIVGINTTD